MLTANDLLDLFHIVIQVRFEPHDPLILDVLAATADVLADDAVHPEGHLRRMIRELPGVAGTKWELPATCLTHYPYVHLRDEEVIGLLQTLCRETMRLRREEAFDRLWALADAWHCLPQMIADANMTVPPDFWQVYMQPYRDQWDADFLRAEQERLSGPTPPGKWRRMMAPLPLARMIDQRRSVRSYLEKEVRRDTLERIQDFLDQVHPLLSEERVAARIIRTADANYLQKWKTPHTLAIFAGEGEDALINAGFMYQQADLFMQLLGLGTCWVGLGKLRERAAVPEGMRLAVLMPFGWPDRVPVREGAAAFQRKSMAEIADRPDERLECVRLAPSATNSQPWYFVHGDGCIHVYRQTLGIVKQRMLGHFNPIDMGIALAHLYVTNQETFRFARQTDAPEKAGYQYVGTVWLD